MATPSLALPAPQVTPFRLDHLECKDCCRCAIDFMVEVATGLCDDCTRLRRSRGQIDLPLGGDR